MVSDKSLLKISAIVSVIGIVILVVAVQFVKPQKHEIWSISDEMTGKAVAVSGTVYSISEKNGNVFMNLYDGIGNIDVVAFGMADSVDVEKGRNITVFGKVAVYNNRLEIIANEIK